MAEGGLFGYDDPDLDFRIDHDDDDKEQEVDRTGAFQPDAASTPAPGGEQAQMQTMLNEQSGLTDTSYEEEPLLGAQSQIQESWDALTRVFPEASATNLETTYGKTGRLQVKMAGFGKNFMTFLPKIGRASNN